MSAAESGGEHRCPLSNAAATALAAIPVLLRSFPSVISLGPPAHPAPLPRGELAIPHNSGSPEPSAQPPAAPRARLPRGEGGSLFDTHGTSAAAGPRAPPPSSPSAGPPQPGPAAAAAAALARSPYRLGRQHQRRR